MLDLLTLSHSLGFCYTDRLRCKQVGHGQRPGGCLKPLPLAGEGLGRGGEPGFRQAYGVWGLTTKSGQSLSGRLLVVSYTERAPNKIRIIIARTASQAEQRQYEPRH